ncbi:MAG TPA: GDSL-type esterase/lipase family protein [Cyclobacteriaceae bacterium]|nr:GDSL-type esterase/lipase family protein [Cyclobacteriaceae bacterium]
MIGRGSLLFVLFVWSNYSLAQDTIIVKSENQFNFINQQSNEIINSSALSTFYEKLYQLRKTKKGTVNIVHIGDSHIQADLLTHTVRQQLQKEFGNAGRGFISPGRIARTNEPQNIYTSSNANWEAKRIVFTDQPLPIGLGATTVRTTQMDAKFVIKTMDSAPLSYDFNGVSVFYQKDFSSFNLILKDSVGHSLAYVGSYTLESHPNFSLVELPYPVHQIEFQTSQPTPAQNQFTLFGLNLTKNEPGVLYHSIGGNGAKFKHYLEAKFFFEQTTALGPDLFIVSLGTNEAIEYPYIDKQFLDHAENFIKRLKQNNPDALFLITTPADFYRKRTRRNPGVESIHSELLQFIDKNNLAGWDLYTVAGGKHSADHWKKNNLLQSDGVHSTRAGYELQGNLLYQALIKGYNEYVRYRYP